ncbi:heavy metal RND efflux outer membrane protein CzcC family [Photobacterium aphoticum]|uniref:Heavy metal RND efflux outer membrane protein CzcC family n=1 Tax=Photobacterium aphoticum TaxID=754436 RepID=A0A090QUL1_9GAMM|nr:heavy metal RND efflux outer membrane protein CzcC family [Photobacterium aphoticum]
MSTPRTVHALSMTLLLGLFGPQPAFAHASENASSSSDIPRSISTSTETADAAESLPRLIQWAISHDLAQQQLNLQADALSEQGIASSQWMDPKLKVGVGGLPVDSFRLDKDPMTNLSVGLMQQFGRGDTLELKNQQSQYLADSVRNQTGVRTLIISKAMTEQWIELVYLQHVQKKMVQNKKLLNTLVQYLSTNYGVGVNQAQDLIQAELQVHRIDDQLNANQQQQQRRLALLSEWIGDQARTIQATQYPQWAVLTAVVAPQVNPQHHNTTSQPFAARLAAHPAITVIESQLQSAKTGIAIAEEAYQRSLGWKSCMPTVRQIAWTAAPRRIWSVPT